MSITTGKGDQGQTELMYGRTVPKSSQRIATYGAIDELTSCLGLVRCSSASESCCNDLGKIQKELITVMGILATHPEDRERYAKDGFESISPAMTDAWEKRSKLLEKDIVLSGWVIPGEKGSTAAAHLDLARSTCRRAEREVATLIEAGEEPEQEIQRYLNRLSDLLWILARTEENS